MGKGSRRLYEMLVRDLDGCEFENLTFHCLQPDVDRKDRVLFAVEETPRRPLLTADTRFMRSCAEPRLRSRGAKSGTSPNRLRVVVFAGQQCRSQSTDLLGVVGNTNPAAQLGFQQVAHAGIFGHAAGKGDIAI